MIALRFTCGHGTEISATHTGTPVCLTCGETQIAGVKAPPPKFRGVARGPYAELAHLDPAVVNVAPGGPLRLKE